MANRKQRIIPEQCREEWHKGHGEPVLADLTVTQSLVTFAITSYDSKGNSDNCYSDADLQLMIARIEVAKEKACERADQVIGMLKAMLG